MFSKNFTVMHYFLSNQLFHLVTRKSLVISCHRTSWYELICWMYSIGFGEIKRSGRWCQCISSTVGHIRRPRKRSSLRLRKVRKQHQSNLVICRKYLRVLKIFSVYYSALITFWCYHSIKMQLNYSQHFLDFKSNNDFIKSIKMIDQILLGFTVNIIHHSVKEKGLNLFLVLLLLMIGFSWISLWKRFRQIGRGVAVLFDRQSEIVTKL